MSHFYSKLAALFHRRMIFMLGVALVTQTPLAAQFIQGIDVSHWQGNINWASVKNAGVEFAFTKATEGVDFIDVRYSQNMAGASAAGVMIGPYHFARPDSFENDPLDAANEANDFVDAIQAYYQSPGLFLRPVLDVERLPDAHQIPIGTTQKSFLSQWIRNFNAVVETRLGFTAMIYSNSNYAINYFESDIAQYDFWLANWNYTPPSTPPSSLSGVWNDWDFWQWTDSWSVPGIAGPVDGDVFEGSMADLMQFLAVPASADFDGDGDVDGHDFLEWQRGETTESGSAGELALWQEQYGGSSPLIATKSVPEAPSILLVSIAWVLYGYKRNRA
ncbi:glycoside hydrolase family 25 protein [Bythopirellula goksoeyrii]|uniref:Lysozyme M1 n=1 Tax=Bythopirellula goksoeyrii TaxID=1400387 RepID=A0A5B9QGU9_9BACT|nr:glycoside hydrolase family 25 protein [Bythopirellula goksoeyrii]QEG37159.1 Lysozyme M1 precursor [Bythopirellula goksoeyrii]